MDEREKSDGPDIIPENIVQRLHLDKVALELAQIITGIKTNREMAPYLREMITISARIPKSIFRYRSEFSFGQISTGRGVLRQLEEWATSLEKQDGRATIILEAYLYPYEQGGGRKLMGITLKAAVQSAIVINPLPIEAKNLAPLVIKRVRRKARVKIAKVVEGENENEKVVVDGASENADVIEEKIESAEAPKKKAKSAGRPELAEIMAELVAQRERNGEALKEFLDKPEGFLVKPIDFDYRKWNLWSTDGTRGLLSRVFKKHNIVTPADLMTFLGTNNPSEQEWRNFIAGLNAHDEARLTIGPNSDESLRKWMRRWKMIPEDFRKN